MGYLFKIGEIAQIFDISVRTLRLYDKIELLQPERVDRNSNYRYYTDKQVNKLRSILGLRRVGFSLDQIKMILDSSLSYKQLIYMMQTKKMENIKEIARINYNNELIDKMIEVAALTKKAPIMDTVSQEDHDIIMSKVSSLENPKLEAALIEILWL